MCRRYTPLFKAFASALSGPLPLLVVLFDIHRVNRIRLASSEQASQQALAATLESSPGSTVELQEQATVELQERAEDEE